MRILVTMPLALQPSVKAAALQYLSLNGGMALDSPYSNDGGATHTHAVACTVVSDENLPIVNQLAPNFPGLTVDEVALRGENDLPTPQAKLEEYGLTPYSPAEV